MSLRVLTWNLQHGRAAPPAGADLLPAFAEALAGWSWHVALLQETPPWWPAALSRRLGGDSRLVLTSRNSLPAARRRIAVRWPDLIKSNGGGANAILTRGHEIVSQHTLRLRLFPERRQLLVVRLAGGAWIGNLHATVRNEPAAAAEARRAASALLAWAAGEPVVLGGDFNVRELMLPGLQRVAEHDVDMVFSQGLGGASSYEVIDRGRLSDHAPVAVTLG